MAFKYCYLNLTIDDILKVTEHPNTTGSFVYGMHSFDRVEVFGTVVSVREYDEKIIYQIDDCTGVIACHEFQSARETTSMLRQFNSAEMSQASGSSGSPVSSLDKLEEIATSLEDAGLNRRISFKLGDFVQFRGHLKEYRGVRRIWVHFSKILDDPNWETFYLARQLELYKKLYDCVTPEAEDATR